jgi:hypothetical protein
MTRKQDPIPAWASTPGATVILEAGGFRRDRTFYTATITRVTKTSVFVNIGKDGRERRFVNTGWNNDDERMSEYGQRDSFHPSAYIWNPEYDGIKEAIKKARVRATELAMAKAARELADAAVSGGGNYYDLTQALYGAINHYEQNFPVVILEDDDEEGPEA